MDAKHGTLFQRFMPKEQGRVAKVQQKPVDPAKRLAELEAARRIFSEKLKAHERAGGRYIERAAEIPQELLTGCQVLANRMELLKLLPKNGIVAEVGTEKAEFAAHILKVAAPKQLHIFEIDPSRIDPVNIQEDVLAGRCKVHPGDSSDALNAMPPWFFDWIYMGAGHSYEELKKDISAAVPRLKEGGMLIFNDYCVWSISSMRRCGVAKAVTEFARRENWKFVYFALQTSMYYDVALVKA